MEPVTAAAVLREKLPDPTKPMTVADASVASGLAQRDTEAGLHFLTSEYRGHLRVTEDGDLVHIFPTGFTKPWEKREALDALLSKVGGALLGAGRFIVRAWLLIAMVVYALAFVGIMIAMTLAGGDRNRSSGAGGALAAGLFRALADAMFWTFHPFSPLYVGGYGYGYGSAENAGWGASRQVNAENKVPFYEKVNRFVFGPPKPAVDPQAMRQKILEEIRVQRGRIGLADVMRVTGLPRDQADPLMAQLMLDHEGEVDVAESGGILYRFEALRRTAEDGAEGWRPRSRAAWEFPKKVAPLTGNSAGANIGISALNLFNIAGGAWVMAHGLTISNLFTLLTTRVPRGAPPIVLPNDGLPLALGLVPLVFSLALFALPLVRGALSVREHKAAAQENARLAILREVLTHAPKKEPVTDESLRTAYRVATGEDASSKEITKRVVELGGDVDVGPEGEVRYRFADLEAEAEALEDERAHAPEAEAKLGRVVFASDQ